MFNALKYTEELEKAGFTQEQAKASLKLIIEVMNEEFATKSDLLAVRSDLSADILSVRNDLTAEIKRVEWELSSKIQTMNSNMKEMENRLTIKLGGMMVVTVGLAVTLMKLT